MVSSALSLCAALLLAAFSAVSKAQIVYVTSIESFPTYSEPQVSYVTSYLEPITQGEGPYVTVDGAMFNDPYNASRDAKCLLTPEQQAAVLLEHNLYRSMFADTPNVTWNDELAQRAAWWVCSGGWRSHPDAPSYDYNIGSNEYAGNGPPVAGVTAWFDEIGLYNYSDPYSVRSDLAGHFTQLVWKGTTEIGCATLEYAPYMYVLVCQYLPAGNVLGEYRENIMPLKPAYKGVNLNPFTLPWAVLSLEGPPRTQPGVTLSVTSNPNPVYTIPPGEWSGFFPSAAQFTYLSATDSLTTTATTSTSSNSNGSTMDAINRLTITETTSTSSNSRGSSIDATDRSTITSKKSTSSNSNGSTMDATHRSTTTSSKSTSSNSNGSTIHVTDRSTTTVTTSTSSNSNGSVMDATDRSTSTSSKSTSISHGSAMDATDRSIITSKKSTSSNSNGSAVNTTNKSIATSKKSTSSNSNGSAVNTTDRLITTSKKSTSISYGSSIDATDRSTTISKKSISSNNHSSVVDATDRSATTATTSTSSNSNGSAMDATGRSTTTATTSTEYTKYALTPEEQAAVVLAHNKLRALHVDTGNLTWSNTLAVYAEKYAAVYDCSSGRLVHSHGPYGENLALGFPNAVAAVDAWYSEIAHYNYSHPGFSMATGHFTQVVWRSTKEVGCAVKHCGSYYRDYVVCEYAPPGNYAGEFPENVMPLKASVSSSTSSKPKSSSTPSATSEKSTSSNSHGSAIDATDRSTITSKKSTSSNSHGSAIDATDRSTITSKRSTSSNNRSSSINATDRSTTLSNNFTSSSSNGSAIDATDRSTTTRTSAPNNSIGSAIGASGKTHVASEGAPAKTNVAHSVTTATVESARTVDVTECPICSLSTATSSFSSQNGQTALHGEPVLRVSTVYTTDGVVITTYTTSCPESAKTGSVTASAATTTAHSDISMESAHANVVPSVSVATSASNSAASVTIAKYEGLAASLTSDVLFSAILMALIHLI